MASEANVGEVNVIAPATHIGTYEAISSIIKSKTKFNKGARTRHWFYKDLANLVTMLDRTGRSAMTAVVMTALLLFSDELDPDVVRTPPVTGLRPRIQTKCCRVCK